MRKTATNQRGSAGESVADPITEWLRLAFQGDEEATERLLNLVYPHLHSIAAAQLRAQPVTLTQAATDVLHEAYERLARQRVEWRNRSHFYALAARLTRRSVRALDIRPGQELFAILKTMSATPDRVAGR